MLTIATGSNKKIDCLEVKVGKNTHKIPLGKDVPISLAREMRKVRKLPSEERDSAMFDVLTDFIETCMGEDAELLTMGDLNDIVAAWGEESNKLGVDAGE